jgi:hypothetical protein
MSMNPYLLELMIKARQEELLALARSQRIGMPKVRRQSLGARMRTGLARLMIRMGWRLAPSGDKRVCPYRHEGEPGSAADPLWCCGCPGRNPVPDGPSLPGG